MIRIGLALVFLLLGALAAPASAQDDQIISMYTKLELETQCRYVKPKTEEEAAIASEFWCEGYRGMPVRVVEGDLRFYLGYGLKAVEQCSSGQTLGPFNTIGKTLEWRLVREFPGHMTPIATILRYTIDSDNGIGEYLVLTKLGETQACHLAFVDARAAPNANRLARDAADRYAQEFDCRKDKPFMMTPSGPAEVDVMLGRGGCE